MPKKTEIKKTILVIVLLTWTCLAHLPGLKNDFINFDDRTHLMDNPMNSTMNIDNIKRIFSTPVLGNYQPMIGLLFAIEHLLVGFNPFYYHLLNLILHLCNTFLILLLISKLINNQQIAFFTALIFGIHPLHVESVAWVSGRKDLLYVFFFILSMIHYLKYLQQGKRQFSQYGYSFVFFLLSCLSKPMAVVLPLVLLLIDYYQTDKISIRQWLEKIPFIIISLIIGIISLNIQQEAGAIQLNQHFSIFDRFTFGAFTFISYLLKFVFPFPLSAYYLYPIKNGFFLPFIYYLQLFVFLFFILLFFCVYKKNKNFTFGILFFFITIALVLQWLPVGGSLIAERYAYLSYFGLAFLSSCFVFKNKNPLSNNMTKILLVILVMVILIFSFLSFNRYKIWKNSDTFWTALIEKYPSFSYAYAMRGIYFLEEVNNKELALIDFNSGLKADPNSFKAYSGRGCYYLKETQFDKAISDFRKSLMIKPNQQEVFNNLGLAYYLSGKTDSAITEFTKAITFSNTAHGNYLNRGNAWFDAENYMKAIEDYNIFISYFPNHPLVYYLKGLCWFELKEYHYALKDIETAIAKGTVEPEVFASYARLLEELHRFKESSATLQKAITLGYNVLSSPCHFDRIEDELNKKGNKLFYEQKYDSALMCYSEALKSNSKYWDVYVNRANTLNVLKQYQLAINDYNIFLKHSYFNHQAYYWRSIARIGLGDLKGALEDLNRTLKLQPELSQANTLRNQILLEIDKK
ncbi:MAG: hypothetical protein A3G23_02635 [Bacteroidetes bacterium RIFCSPLOWO2_12_FULL_37_12]|nr:MAG: hypothetical protein A3G23_02635 [Bacteroidetes bacterium RIFCSPLOWO2_12_FULL_37_12]